MESSLQFVILAAGKGTRMRSDQPKVLHRLLGQSLVHHVITACAALKPERIVTVTGYHADEVEEHIRNFEPLAYPRERLHFARQEEQLGTGHAVWCARSEILSSVGQTIILCGDGPLIQSSTLKALVEAADKMNSDLSMITYEPPDATGYGRIKRNEKKQITAIVEQKEASEAELAITECNSGTYLFNTKLLIELLDQLMQSTNSGEYYLTDLVEMAVAKNIVISSIIAPDFEDCLGINDQAQLAEAEKILQKRRQ